MTMSKKTRIADIQAKAQAIVDSCKCLEELRASGSTTPDDAARLMQARNTLKKLFTEGERGELQVLLSLIGTKLACMNRLPTGRNYGLALPYYHGRGWPTP